MITYKIKHKGYISSLYLPENPSGKKVVLLPGLPVSSNIDKVISICIEAGAVVYYPQFGGTFDSVGVCDGVNHIKDIGTFIHMAQQEKVKELYYGKLLSVGDAKDIILVGMSYSGVHVLLSKNKAVSKKILLSPVLLYNQKDISKIIQFDFKSQMKHLLGLLKNALPFSYRISDYKKMQQFLFGEYDFLRRKNIEHVFKNTTIPTLIVHGTKDTSVPNALTEAVLENAKNENIAYISGGFGHSNSSYTDEILEIVKNFLR